MKNSTLRKKEKKKRQHMKFKTTLKIVQSQIGKFKHLEKENLIFKKMQIQMWKSTLRKEKKKKEKKIQHHHTDTYTNQAAKCVCVCVQALIVVVSNCSKT